MCSFLYLKHFSNAPEPHQSPPTHSLSSLTLHLPQNCAVMWTQQACCSLPQSHIVSDDSVAAGLETVCVCVCVLTQCMLRIMHTWWCCRSHWTRHSMSQFAWGQKAQLHVVCWQNGTTFKVSKKLHQRGAHYQLPVLSFTLVNNEMTPYENTYLPL